MRRAASLMFLALMLAGCQQRGSDDQLADADAQERARQEKAARAMVAQTEDQVRVKMLEQRVAALEAQVAAMQGDRKLLDAQLVEQRLNQIEAARVDAAGTPAAAGSTASSSAPSPARNNGASPVPSAGRSAGRNPVPPARKPLVLDLK